MSLEDDPTLPIFTLRSVVLGIGFAAFASVLGQLFVSVTCCFHACPSAPSMHQRVVFVLSVAPTYAALWF